MGVESYRKSLNKRQTELRQVMQSCSQHEAAIELFLTQHASLHTSKMARTGSWSYEDEILNDLPEGHMRTIPQNYDHSIVWNIWHIARIEDVAMNLLVAGSAQILNQDDWLERMKLVVRNTGNAMDKDGVANLSAGIDIEALRAYRMAVGRRTRQIVQQLQPQELTHKVEPSRLQRVMDEGAVVEQARELIEYWSRRNITGLLLMPTTRHNIVHLNESFRIKRRLHRSATPADGN